MIHLAELGYWGMFFSAFFAATILPLGSEIVFTTLLLSGVSPHLLLFSATIGNVLGSFANYGLGYLLPPDKLRQWFKMSEAQFDQAYERFQRYGTLSLIFAWVPIIGDPLTLIAGVLQVKLRWFFCYVTLGKFGRYFILMCVILTMTPRDSFS